MLQGDLTPLAAPWFTNSEDYAQVTSAQSYERLDGAFRRWRDLFSAAENQRDMARRIMDTYALPASEKNAARSRHAQALDQIHLLQKGSSSSTSDFYTYRYLATEGFLPGYNFPRLPLMAYIPASNDGRGRQAFLQRPRFLALSEFGPRSLVYHEGRAYRVTRAMLSLGSHEGTGAGANLPTRNVRLCAACGAGHFDETASTCHACGTPLGDAEIVKNIYRIENVATHPAERITANDEERQRVGFELQTTFQWAIRDQVRDVRQSVAHDQDGALLHLSYGSGATITRINKGLRRRANRTQFGFKIDPVTGYWAKNDDEDADAVDPTAQPRQWIVPTVEDRKNALLIKPAAPDLSQAALTTLQHALLRGLEEVFQLEEGEILGEPLPNRDKRNGFLLYEATEGGAGVLTRLVSQPESLAMIARAALRIMHFDVPEEGDLSQVVRLSDVPGTACVAGCYKCLLSYFNQPDHEQIDRRDEAVQRTFLRLAMTPTTEVAPSASVTPSSPQPPAAGPLAAWMKAAAEHDVPPCDHSPLQVLDIAVPLVWRSHYAAGTIEPFSPEVEAALLDKGFEIVRFGDDKDQWPAAFGQLRQLLGR
jgi:hypothetical protein